MSRWPKDNQSALLAFYGTPGADVERQLVSVVPPFRMYYDGKPVKAIKFHRRAAPALTAALNEIWEKCGHDQAKLDRLGVSKYSGAYNPRYIRGSTTKWSNHAYGAAIDLNAEQNGFNTGHGNMPPFVIDAFKRQGARWGGDYRGRTDPMHFEFCDGGLPPVTFADLPQTDGDTDVPPQPDVEPVEEKPKTFWAKIKNWVLGGGAGSLGIGGGLFSGIEWEVVAVVAGVGLIVFLVYWFFPRKA